MSKTIKVTYNSDTLETTITVDGKPFDTSRINGKEIADWAYPFMMRKVKWNGFYDEMVSALGGEKAFNLVFDGSEADLNELKEAWENAPVTIVSGNGSENLVVIEYDENSLTTSITVNGKPFDTSRINGKEIADWAYPFMMRKVKWNGFYDEMVSALGGEKAFDLVFDGSEADLNELKEAWENAPVTIVSGNNSENIVAIEYDENSLTTNISVNGKPFDTSRINGMKIEDWICPFKWNGIFEELAEVVGSDKYTIKFLGNEKNLLLLKEDSPQTITIMQKTEREILLSKLCAELINRKKYISHIEKVVPVLSVAYEKNHPYIFESVIHRMKSFFTMREILTLVPNRFLEKYKKELVEKAKKLREIQSNS